MLLPPPQFQQLKALAWSAPTIAAMGFGFAIHSHWPGIRSEWFWGGMIAAALCAGALAQLAIWRSQWGTRHQLVSVGASLLFFVVPWGTMIMPYAVPTLPFLASAAVVTSHLVLLLASALWHGQRAAPPVRSGRVDWAGCRIDGVKALFRRHEGDAPAGRHPGFVEPMWIGGLSVVLYQALRTWLPADALILAVAVMAWALCAWLCWGPLGRALGQAWKLRQAERAWQVTFTCTDIQTFQSQRSRSRWGRMWARL